MELNINGKTYPVEGDGARLLIYVLRNDLHLTGTRFGCGAGFCGSCTVLVDGRATRACITPLNAVAGKAITTIEGLSRDGRLHPLQQAFIEEQAPQCGWCMSGQIMNAAGLLLQNPRPTDEQIAGAMAGNLCRCGAYARVKRAIQKAAQSA